MNRSSRLENQVSKLPSKPGVYIYRDINHEIIYVGKAINLKKRVTQYFQRDDALGPKTNQLVSQIDDIDHKVVGSEIEALILEASLIKKHKPKYNSQLKDDRSYLYICITKDHIPIVTSAHRSTIPQNSYIYGPFPSGSAVKSLLKTIRRIFPYYSKTNHPKTDCLYCHIGLCPGPTPNLVKYKKDILNIRRILSGNFKKLEGHLKIEMKNASKSENYESAIKIRTQIEALNYIVSGWHSLNNLFETTNLAEDENSIAVNELQTILQPYFPKLNKINRIECFDISQMGFNFFVGSMSVFNDEGLDNSQYRKFKIRAQQVPNDQLMIKEVVFRRLNHPEWNFPDIIVVDGGKPQVSAVAALVGTHHGAFTETATSIPLIGLAKRLETIVIKTRADWVEVNLPKNSNALRLLQRLRDEAHRFANKYRKELISKTLK